MGQCLRRQNLELDEAEGYSRMNSPPDKETLDSSEPECPICEDTMLSQIGILVRCTHMFHTRCALEWFSRQEEKLTCPVCCSRVSDEGGLTLISKKKCMLLSRLCYGDRKKIVYTDCCLAGQ